MILHPGILSLLIGTCIVVAMILYASFLGIRIIRHWDINSASMQQLELERKTYLISTVMNFVLGFELLSTFLFIYTVDAIHETFVGAMCATGSLNANPVGWYALYTKILIFFLASVWIGLNGVDQRAEDYPLTRIKYWMLLGIAPVVLVDGYLMLRYFLGLEPNRITSCCGSLFSESGAGVAASLASLPLVPSMVAFYLAICAFLAVLVLCLRTSNPLPKYLAAILAVLVLLVSLGSMVSFISLYFYELPTHHCPFDILQDHYHWIGYPVYFTLFTAVVFGLLIGVMQPFAGIKSLQPVIPGLQKKWARTAIGLTLLFTAITTWPILFSDFSMVGY